MTKFAEFLPTEGLACRKLDVLECRVGGLMKLARKPPRFWEAAHRDAEGTQWEDTHRGAVET